MSILILNLCEIMNFKNNKFKKLTVLISLFAILDLYLNIQLIAIKRSAKTMSCGRQQLSLAVCDAQLHADRGPHTFFTFCALHPTTCSHMQRRWEKYVVACAVALLRKQSGIMAFCCDRQL